MEGYDIVLVEKPLDEGLSKQEIIMITERLGGEMFIPFEVWGDFSTATGFCNQDVAEKAGYDLSAEEEYVMRILNDMTLEDEEPHEYTGPDGVTILMWRM